ncbi:MAG: protein-glutamate O-methyltransferase CheR [Candidatus Obscuribacterales bacterium]|nr:protein-glutamate O-methyltransferase CheR [Candidatus Obscuribacterales bacterium]
MTENEQREFDDLLVHIYSICGYDLRNYSLPSMQRRFARFRGADPKLDYQSIKEKIQNEPAYLDKLLLALAVSTSSIFRDPALFAELRNTVLPQLKNKTLRVWSAGCSSGEEAYSIAILLREEGFADHFRIYATDVNEQLLQRAVKGVYPLHSMQTYTNNYLSSGGHADFSTYYTCAYGKVIFHESLRRNITFAQHNLAVDGSFNEFDLIFCRNVLIYFNPALQELVHKLLFDSLVSNGVLALGDKESLAFSTFRRSYKQIAPGKRLFRKTD